MKYDELIESISFIIESDEIYKEGLQLYYTLEPKNHRDMQETFFYRTNEATMQFTPTEEFEVAFGDVLVKFIKKPEETE